MLWPVLHPATLQPLINPLTHTHTATQTHIYIKILWMNKIQTYLFMVLTFYSWLLPSCVLWCDAPNLLLWLGLTGRIFFFFSSQSLAHCLAAATTPLCAFVTVATNSKARERCFIAVDVNVRRAGLSSNSYVTHICVRSQTNNTHWCVHT